MELWLDLLFGNAVGLSSVLVILTTCIIVGYLFTMFYKKAMTPPNDNGQ